MSPEIIGIACLVILLVLMYARMWIGFVMLFVGFWGIVVIAGWDVGLEVMATIPYRTVADYVFAAMPLFLMMGVIVTNTGFASDMFYSAYKWIGQLRGGLAMATCLTCAILGVVTDSMVAVITMGKVAVPEMRKYRYSDVLSTASVVSGASLASLIPPSIAFILYGMLTRASIGKLYVGAIIPGILLAVLMLLLIGIQAWLNPTLAPAGPKTSFKEKLVSLKYTGGVGALFLLILGGIYAGVFTPTEAGAIGAFGSIVFGLLSHRLNKQSLVASILETAQMTAMIVVLVVGAFVFMKLMALSKLPFVLGDFVAGLNVSRYVILAAIILMYVVLGMFTDIMASILLTMPIIFPVIVALGFDPIWYGVVIVIVIEMGFITPPFGLSVFLLAGITNIPASTIFRGVWQFVAIILLFVIILTIFPQIVLFLPATM